MNTVLQLEEKLIREEKLSKDLENLYQIGKNYEDCYRNNFLSSQNIYKQEYARRCIFYFEQVINCLHNQDQTIKAPQIDEMIYCAMNGIGNAYRFLGEHYKAIDYYRESEKFAPPRNDHLIYLTETYWELMDYKKMLQCTTKMMHPDRINPFPEYNFFLSTDHYHNTGNLPQTFHNHALELSEQIYVGTIFALNKPSKKRLFIVDDFYEDPYLIRNFALQQEFKEDLRYYKGKRTTPFHTPQIKQKIEEIIGQKITVWDQHGMNGVFQYCTPQDALVYHWDEQTWAGMVYLTPDAPYQSGTSLFAHKQTRARCATDAGSDVVFNGGFYDRSKFELVDTAGNIFNRLVIFDARCIHAANEYFGQTIEDSRLFHLFFFD